MKTLRRNRLFLGWFMTVLLFLSQAAMPLHAATIESHGDHRIAMAFAIAGLFASGETVIRNTACVNTSYPGFAKQLAAVLAESKDLADYDLPTVPVPA